MQESTKKKNDWLLQEFRRCEKWIQAALNHGGNTHDTRHVYEGILDEKFQFWATPDACMITELIDYPNYRVIHVWLAGGNLETILKMRPDIERFGQHFGCKHITINGRPGWAKALKGFGYTPSLLTVSKDLGTMQPEADGG